MFERTHDTLFIVGWLLFDQFVVHLLEIHIQFYPVLTVIKEKTDSSSNTRYFLLQYSPKISKYFKVDCSWKRIAEQ